MEALVPLVPPRRMHCLQSHQSLLLLQLLAFQKHQSLVLQSLMPQKHQSLVHWLQKHQPLGRQPVVQGPRNLQEQFLEQAYWRLKIQNGTMVLEPGLEQAWRQHHQKRRLSLAHLVLCWVPE